MLLLSVTQVSADDAALNILQNGDLDCNLEPQSHWADANAIATFQTEGNKAKPITGKKVAYIRISKAVNAARHTQFY